MPIEAYKECLEAKPDYENANLNLGLAYKGLRQRAKAIQCFKEELKYHPDNVYAYVELGLVYKELGDYPECPSSILRKRLLILTCPMPKGSERQSHP